LWHVAGQPLSTGNDGLPAGAAPWAGWVTPSRDASRFVSLQPEPASSVIYLSLWSRHRPYSESELRSLSSRVSYWMRGREFLAASHLSWIGDRYSIIGSPAHPATRKWWSRLQRWMRATATPLTADRQVTFFAFPSALRRLHAGVQYNARGWDLGPALAAAAKSASRSYPLGTDGTAP
jgi:hypothetical protein